MARHLGRSASALAIATAAALSFAGGARAGTIGLGNIVGNDASSDYNCPTGTSGTSDCFGTLTFDDGTPGTVDSDTFGDFFVGASLELEITLYDLTNQGTPGPFTPGTTNMNRARFEGANAGTGLNGQAASDLRIVAPNGNVLLAWDIKYIDVASFTEAGGGDPDGSVTLGSDDEDFFDARRGSYLTLVGGTLNVVGDQDALWRLGRHATIQVQMASLSPILASKNAFLGSDFTAGPGPANTFAMTITQNPEPGTVGLLGLGLLGLSAAAKRRARKR